MATSTLRPCLALLATLLFTGAAHADDAKPACQYAQLGELPLRYTGSGLQVTTDGIIDGTPASMLVDTGASVALSRTLTERLGLPLQMTGQYSEGFGGLSRIYNARLHEFAIGPAKAAHGWFRVFGETGAPPQWDAIAGADFLLQVDMELDLANKKMRFFRGKNCRESYLGYWGGTIFEIPFEYHNDRSRNPHFTVEVNGQKMEAIIDSGASTTLITASAAKRAGLSLNAPGSHLIGYANGVGSDRPAEWSTVVDSLRIGGERISNATVAVVNTDVAAAEVFLGDDYLRAHRVLFAMSQEKLYISYLGGDPFKPRSGAEPWIMQEAESGNPDAQLLLANAYRTGKGVPQDAQQAAAWLDKAVASGHPPALLQSGRDLVHLHRYADAAVRLRQALDKMPAERYGALSLYTARLHTGEPDLAKRELEATFAHDDHDEWPAPIADFYLGRIDAAAMMDAAGKDKKRAQARSCSATSWMTSLYEARGDSAKADASRAIFSAHCAPAAKPAKAGGA